METKKIVFVAAARPNFMKVGPLLKAAREMPGVTPLLVHTGQHYDANMSDTFFEQLGIPEPDVNLGIGKGTHAQQTGQTMIAFEAYLAQTKPDAIVVVGDVNATMACAIVGTKMGILVAHVEAGLRSFDRAMPEEINRLLTDAISDVLYTPSSDADMQLLLEGVDEARIVMVGNIMMDTLFAQLPAARALDYPGRLGLDRGAYGVVTLHRPSNVDSKATLEGILDALDVIAREYTLVLPVHPRARAQFDAFGLMARFSVSGIMSHRINLVDPLGYREMLSLVEGSGVVVTDSGGLQEETTALHIPCLTVRDNTERPVTITEGTNVLAGTTTASILAAYRTLITHPKMGRMPLYWDGETARRVLDDLVLRLGACELG